MKNMLKLFLVALITLAFSGVSFAAPASKASPVAQEKAGTKGSPAVEEAQKKDDGTKEKKGKGKAEAKGKEKAKAKVKAKKADKKADKEEKKAEKEDKKGATK